MINYSITIMSAQPGTKKEDISETKAYGVAQMNDKMDLDALAQHMSNHNSPFSKGVIKGILTDTVSCIRHLLLDGKKVSLGDLGDFHVELNTTGAKTADAFTAANIKEVNIRWSPGKEFKNLRDVATFQLVPNRASQKSAVEVIKNQDTIQGLE